MLRSAIFAVAVLTPSITFANARNDEISVRCISNNGKIDFYLYASADYLSHLTHMGVRDNITRTWYLHNVVQTASGQRTFDANAVRLGLMVGIELNFDVATKPRSVFFIDRFTGKFTMGSKFIDPIGQCEKAPTEQIPPGMPDPPPKPMMKF